MCPRLSANYVSCCPPNMAQVSVWADNLQGPFLSLRTSASQIFSFGILKIAIFN